MDELETKYIGDIEKSGQELERLKQQAAQFDHDELIGARLALRPQMESETRERIQSSIPDRKPSVLDYQLSVSETDKQLRDAGLDAQRKDRTHEPRKADMDR